MICFRDRTYCCSPNCKDKCGRKLTEQVKQDAVKWWGNDDAPIAVAEFCDAQGNLIEHERIET